jgi:hypothetical protein
MSLHHFPFQAIDSSWHAVYRSPQADVLNSIGDGLTERGAQRMCDEANREQAHMEATVMVVAADPADRRIPKGFYSNEEAA